MTFTMIYFAVALATILVLLFINASDEYQGRDSTLEMQTREEYYNDDGDGAALILGVVFGGIMWPLTIGIFIYYKYFDNPTKDTP